MTGSKTKPNEQRLLNAARCPNHGTLPAQWDFYRDEGEVYVVFLYPCCDTGTISPKDQVRASLQGYPTSIPMRLQDGTRAYVGAVVRSAAAGVPYYHLPTGPSINQAINRAHTRVMVENRRKAKMEE